MKPPGQEQPNNGTKLDALRKREAELREAIAKEKIRQQKTKARLQAREALILGEAVCKHAEQSPDFKLMLKQLLPSVVTDEAPRKFLANRGWWL